VVYRFIEKHQSKFGVRWLLRRLGLSPNAYYNYRKGRKSGYYVHKQEVLRTIERIYHDTEGKPGHRSIMIFLARKGVFLSKTTIHKYMNKELGLTSIVRRKRPGYVKGNPHKVFPNLLNQNFTARRANQLWCTDLTYLFLKDGKKRYNCSIIDSSIKCILVRVAVMINQFVFQSIKIPLHRSIVIWTASLAHALCDILGGTEINEFF